MAHEETGTLEEAVEPAVAVPVDASGSATAVAFRTLALQVIGFVGLLIGVLGLGEDTWIVKIYRVARTDNGFAMICLAAGILAGAYQQLRGLKKHKGLQVLSLLLPQRVAKSPANPTPAVVTAAKAAIVAIETSAAPTPPAPSGEER
jgi:hypothetical protein